MIVDQRELIRRGARNFGNKKAIVYKAGRPSVIEGISLTFHEVNERANKLANALGVLGLDPGTRVGTLAHNCLEYTEIMFGLIKGGFPQTILNPMLAAKEIQFQIAHSKSSVVILQHRYAQMIHSIRDQLPNVKHFISFDGKDENMLDYEALLVSASGQEVKVDVDPESLAELRYTGGTTGTPKGIMLPSKCLVAVTRDLLMEYLGDLTSQDRWLAIQPLFHGAGWFTLPAWVKGMTQYVVNDFHAESALEVIQKEKITAIKTIPTVLMRLLDSPDIRKIDVTHIKTVIYGGEPFPVQRIKEGVDVFGYVFMQLYGQTEAPMIISVLKKEDHQNERLLKSVGRPATMVKVKVVNKHNAEVSPGEIGEVVVTGDHRMIGYLDNPEATREILIDGWVHTKDLGVMDKDGFLYLSGGRVSDMIISGGENIYPQEVEQVLYQHPSVSEACVFGVPDARWGEAVKAAVVFRRNKTASEEELIHFCKERLASYKKPHSIYFLEELPKSGAGKIVRKDLRKMFTKSD
jgi:long-chain acyl-CoA synthetase